MYFQLQISTFLTEDDLRSMGVDANNVEQLASKFIVRLEETPVPTPGDYERVQELQPLFVPNNIGNPLDSTGVYLRQYQIVDMFPADVQELDPLTGNLVTVTVQQQKDRYLQCSVKAPAKQDITRSRVQAEAQGATSSTGLNIDTSPEGVARLQLIKDRSDANPADPVFVTAQGTSQETTRASLLTSYTEVSDRLHVNAQLESVYHTAVDSAPDISSVTIVCNAAVSVGFPSSDLTLPVPTAYVDFTLTYDSQPEDLLYLGNPLPKTGPAGPSGQVVEFDLRSLVSSPSVAVDVIQVNGDTTGSLNLVKNLDVYFKLGKPYIQFDDKVSPGTHTVSVRLAKIG